MPRRTHLNNLRVRTMTIKTICIIHHWTDLALAPIRVILTTSLINYHHDSYKNTVALIHKFSKKHHTTTTQRTMKFFAAALTLSLSISAVSAFTSPSSAFLNNKQVTSVVNNLSSSSKLFSSEEDDQVRTMTTQIFIRFCLH